MRFYSSKRLLGLFMALGLASSTVVAGLLPTEVTLRGEGSAVRYTYSVTLTSDLKLHPGDYFTIYDFAGFVPGSNAQPANFTFSTANTGPTPARLAPSDDASIPNLTWTYSGPTASMGQEFLGDFSAQSMYGRAGEDAFTARTHRIEGSMADSNITDTTVPVPCAPEVPEPTTLLLLAAGLPFCGAAHWLRRRKNAI